MTWFGGFKRIRKTIRKTETLRDQPGPLAARAALDLILPALNKLDREPRFTLITSGTSIDYRGRSFVWEFFFDLPGRRAKAVLTVQPCGEAEIVDDDKLCLVINIRPEAPQKLSTRLLNALKHDPAGRQHMRDMLHRERATIPALPMNFRDSPTAVAALSRQGADFIAGDTHMVLASTILPSNEVVWRVYHYDQELTTPFSASRQV